jgi:hypothetical protein
MGLKGFEVTKAADVYSKLTEYKKHYHDKGVYLGFEAMHEHYSMQLGNCTDWTGYPMSGKTQVLMECLINTSIFYGWKHLIYFPDVGSNVEIIADLIHKKTGKTFDPTKPNAITDEEIAREINWVTHHFKVLTKSDIKAKMTATDFWDYAVKLKNEEGLETASIDSWKDLNHPYNEFGGYAQYLEFVLPYRNQIAEDNNLHLHTIIHPKLTEKEANGNRKAPVPYDLKGGSEWFNSGKCMITVHREDLNGNAVDIYFNKIKPRSIGKIGNIHLLFDLDKFRYYTTGWINNATGFKKYAEPKEVEVKQMKIISTDLNKQQGFGFEEPKAKEENDIDMPF